MASSEYVTSFDETRIWATAVGNYSGHHIVFIPGTFSDSLIFEKQFEDPELKEHLYLVRHPVFSGYLVLMFTREGSVRPSRTGME